MPSIYLPPSVYRRILKHEYLKGLDIEKAKNNPVCPRCERVALRDKGYTENKIARCPHCGYHGRMDTTLAEYLGKEMYK